MKYYLVNSFFLDLPNKWQARGKQTSKGTDPPRNHLIPRTSQLHAATSFGNHLVYCHRNGSPNLTSIKNE